MSFTDELFGDRQLMQVFLFIKEHNARTEQEIERGTSCSMANDKIGRLTEAGLVSSVEWTAKGETEKYYMTTPIGSRIAEHLSELIKIIEQEVIL